MQNFHQSYRFQNTFKSQFGFHSHSQTRKRKNLFKTLTQQNDQNQNNLQEGGYQQKKSDDASLLRLPQNGFGQNNSNGNDNSNQSTFQQQFFASPGFSLPKPLYLLTINCDENDVLFTEQLLEQITEIINRKLCNAIMLSDCALPSHKFQKVAQQIYNLCDTLQIHFFIESRLEVAAACNAHGIIVSPLVDIFATRKFLESCVSYEEGTKWISQNGTGGGPVGVLDDEARALNRPVFCGRTVHDEREAVYAQRDTADFVVVDIDNRAPLSDRELKTELRGIRRRVSQTVIVSHSFCKACGGPKDVVNAGADGLQIPINVLIPLIKKQAEAGSEISVQQLPEGDRLTGAIMLVAGGTIGAGIIALPVKTAAAGFIPTMFTLSCSWFFMCLTALLLLEMSIWYGPGTNLTTMAENTLGKYGKLICAVLYLFIYTATITAYIAEGARYLTAAFSPMVQSVPMWGTCVIFAAVFGATVQGGTKWADRVNGYCVVLALSAYLFLLTISAQTINLLNLAVSSWPQTIPTLPIMVVAFCFHNIVPSLLGYLGTAKRVFIAIVAGSFIPLVMYLLWEGVILGSLQAGTVLQSTEQIVEGMRMAVGDRAVIAVTWFSLLAIITSFLGVLLGFVDFNKDLFFRKYNLSGDGQSSNVWSVKGLLPLFSTLLPPLVVAISAPGIFYSAMEFSGTLRMVLFGVIPVMMVWIGRKKQENRPFLPGGKFLLVGIMFIALSMIVVEVRAKILYFAKTLPVS